MDTKLQIVRNGGLGWRVVNPGDQKPEIGETVTWAFTDPARDIKAFLQFPTELFDANTEGDPTDGKDLKLSKHHTGRVEEFQTLTLQVSKNAVPKKRYEYAVFVVDGSKGGHSGFAIGRNPPPDITLGP